MKPPILLIEVIENAQKYNSEIRIKKKDGDRFYAYVLGRGYSRSLWKPALELRNVIRDCNFTGTIVVEE